ncbi:hypothetical protein ACFPYI_13760 [Halomarina salina]|uniref:Envelope protein N-terminal domain-containing protein n=1 Tax=Halomarina salina TaxID=1872699 RepID=A0ABD5RP62_9EURY|nr:hypothetical protein [Halomarina salina]
MRGSNALRTASAFVLAFMLVTSTLAGVVMVQPAASPVQPARADIGAEGCVDDATIGLVTGTVTTLYSNVRDPCWQNGNEVVDADSAGEARLAAAVELLEDERHERITFNQFAKFNDQLSSPAYLDGKTHFVSSMRNGSSEVEAITDARSAVRDRVSAQQIGLVQEWNAMSSSIGRTAWEAEDAGVGDVIKAGVIQSDGTIEEYQLTNVANKSAAQVQVQLANGSTRTVNALYQTDGNGTITATASPFEQDVFVAVNHPEQGWKMIVNEGDATRFEELYHSNSPASGSVVYTNESAPTNMTYRLDASGTQEDSNDVYIGNTSTHEFRVLWKGDSQIFVYGADGSGVEGGTPDISWSDGSGSRDIKLVESNGEFDVYSEGELKGTVEAPSSSTMEVFNSGDLDSVTVDYDTGELHALENFHNQYKQVHNDLITTKDTVLAGLGDADSGYLSDAYNAVQLGKISWSDLYTPGERHQLTVEPSDVGEAPWQSFQYGYLGFSSQNMSSVNTMDMTFTAGTKVNNQTLDAPQTVSGTVWMSGSPPNQVWETGEDYNVSVTDSSTEINTALYVTATVPKQEFVNGSVTYGVEGKTFEVTQGRVIVEAMRDSDGENVGTVGHTPRDPTSANVSKLTETINALQQQIEILDGKIDEDNDGNTVNVDPGDWFDGPIIDGPVIPSMPSVPNVPIYVWAGAGVIIVYLLKGGGGAAVRAYDPRR